MPYKAKLVTRSTDTSTVTEDTLNKGSALTHGELDSDLINLRDQSIGIASDDSTVIDVGMGNTLTIAGGAGISTTVSGQTVTIAADGTITIVGDDSTGTAINIGETFKIAGASGITTAVSGDTLTITGPSLASYITASSTDTLTNKTINLSSNTLTGTIAQFNTAVSDADLATLAGTETLTNKTLTTPIISSISNTGTLTLPTSTDTLVGRATTDTLTNKTLTAPVINGEISSSDSTFIQINDGLAVTGDIKGDSIIINNISSGDSTAIQINDAMNISGAVTTHGATTFNSYYRDKINSLTSSTTITVDANLAPTHKVTLGTNTAFVISNLPTGGNLTLIIVQDATGSRTASFGTDGSTAVKFAGGTSTLSTPANSIDIVNIYNDGTNYYGSLAKAFA